MNVREKAYAYIKNRARTQKEERAAALGKLREDEKFDDMYRALNSLRWDVARKDGEEKEKAKAQCERVKKELVDYLISKGYSEDLLSDAEICNKCHDTGVCDGKMCECAEKVRIDITRQKNPLLRGLADSHEKIDFSFYRGCEKNYKIYADFIEKKFVQGDLNYVVLSGKPGTAKSYLASVFTNEMLVSGNDVRAVNALEMNKIFLAYHCAFLENKQEIWDELVEPDVLFIDDLGVEPLLNNVTLPCLYALLVERMEKKTIITTNLGVVETEKKYDQRIVSRLLDKRRGAMLPIEGDDFRF